MNARDIIGLLSTALIVGGISAAILRGGETSKLINAAGGNFVALVKAATLSG